VELATRVDWGRSYLFTLGDKNLSIQGNIVDSGFLRVFSFPLLKGHPAKVLEKPYSIVVTEKFAKKFFGDQDPIGKTVQVNRKDIFTITGLLKDLPTNSRFDFEYLLPWSYMRSQGDDDTYWGNNSTKTYVLLKPNTSLAGVQEKIKKIKFRHEKSEVNNEMFLYPMDRWRLYSKV
jgi:hypothetical protein